jgi:hypothetical protein
MSAELAKKALEYLKSQGVKHINLLPGEERKEGSWEDGIYDRVMYKMVQEGAKGKMKNLRREVLAVLRGGGTAFKKRQQVENILAPVFDYARQNKGDVSPFFDSTRGSMRQARAYDPYYGGGGNKPDEPRIRHTRKALKFGYGNCSQKSSIVATWLLENSVNVPIFIMRCNPYDHAYVLLGNVDFSQRFSRQPDDVFVVDGWSDDFYPANNGVQSEGEDLRPYGSPNGLQMNLRKILVGEQLKRGNILEEVHEHKRPLFAPGFCLARAREPSPKGPAGSKYPDGVTASDVQQAEATTSGSIYDYYDYGVIVM